MSKMRKVAVGERITERPDAREEKVLYRVADTITVVCSSLPFLAGNALFFAFWVVLNTLLPWHVDPYPFQFLTMAVSLEAIFLSLFILSTQTRQAELDRRNMLHDIAVSEQTEREGQEVQRMLSETMRRVDLIYQMLQRQE